MSAVPAKPTRQAWCHVDMDGLDAIYRGHGRRWTGPDAFYTSAVDNSLELFGERAIAATYFVIARDLDDRDKRSAIERVVAAGHRIACHGVDHLYLNRETTAAKRREIFDGKARIEDALGVSCQGFRAPGYSIDFESLELLRDAGYRYDSSIFPNYHFRKRLGVHRLLTEPFQFFPDSGFFEIPMPHVGPWLPPFHPCYAFYLSSWYFRRNLAAFERRSNYLTLLFHLTDFAAPQKRNGGIKLGLFTNNYFSESRKVRFLHRLLDRVQRTFQITSTEEFLARWPESAPDLNPRTILGISTTHETGACIVRGGELAAAINEERLSRRKLDTRYPPVASIREVIRIAGIHPRDIDAVAVAGLEWRELLPQTLESLRVDIKDFHGLIDYIPHFCRVLYRLFYFWRAVQYDRVAKFLRDEYGVTPKIHFVEHHEAHAACAYRGGPADRDVLVITADGVGDDLCITFSQAARSTIRRVESFFYPNSFGQFYTACTQILGFKGGRHEGKITGLSGYGKPNEALLKALETTLLTDDGGFRLHKRYYAEGFIRLKLRDLGNLLRGRVDTLSVDYRNYKAPLKRLLKDYTREDVAYAFQHLLEREMVRLTRRHTNGSRVHLALAGGVFANVKLNAALARGVAAESVFIYPNMGDGGLCVGAALSVSGSKPATARDMYLGTGYGEDEILAAIAEHPDVTVERPEDLAATVAAALVDSKIVARFDGRMEFGPRALGNRSILYHCADPSVNAWLNKQLRRTEFMPFAPMCIYEDADEYFHIDEGEKYTCEYMTYVVGCTEKMTTTCPAAVHVDGTARPQLVRQSVNPEMYAILQAYKARTGLSVVINTSFNMHEEPIVRSPSEALSAFRQSHLDILVLGPFIVRQDSGRQLPRAEEAREYAWAT